jgi:hypothetical protein
MVFLLSSVLGGGDGDGGSDGSITVAEGITGTLASMPALPPGLSPLSDFVEFEADDKDRRVIIGLQVREAVTDPAGLGFYTFFDSRWQRVADVTLQQEGRFAEGDFPTVPDNLAVLDVVAQIYQVAGSLPAGGALHPDARVGIVSPRDYSPAADGSVQGTATTVSAEGVAVIPTIVGSNDETAAVVDDILDDEALLAQHIQEIASLVQAGNFAGIDLEYSSVNVDLSGRFTQFVGGLAEALHRNNKRLSLTLPPPSEQRQAYDWEKLGESADLIRILPIADPVTYWETMPAALNRVVEDVDPARVMLVVSPFSVESDGDAARPIGYLQAMVLAAESVVREPANPNDMNPGATVKVVARNLDEGEGGSPLRWSDDAAAVTFALGGTERHRIYIENSFSAAFKLELVQAFGLGGVSVADASAGSDVANLWPAVNGLASSATVALLRPNDSALLPVWQAPDGGDLGAGAGTSATWIAPDVGSYGVFLIVSDGERRFGRRLPLEVKASNQPTPSPLITFGSESPTPTPLETPSGETPTPEPGAVSVEVGLRVEGDDADTIPTNDELTSPGSDVTYFVIFDNDSDVPVSISSLIDDSGADVECTSGGGDVTGAPLDADDGDGPGEIDGGADVVECTFTLTATDASGKTVDLTVTGTVEDEDGNSDSDSDGASYTTS